MEPKVEFLWSWIYQYEYHSPSVSEEYNYDKYEKFVKDYIKSIKQDWEKVGSRVFSLLSELTGLSWKEKKIPCYVIKRSSLLPISSPLTIPIEHEGGKNLYSLTKERFIDMLTHELIHNLFIQNEKTDKYFDLIFDKYPGEEFNTVLHLIVHALHKKIFLEIFDEKRLKKEIEISKFYPEYKRSWEIVEGEGEDKIIEEFRSLY